MASLPGSTWLACERWLSAQGGEPEDFPEGAFVSCVPGQAALLSGRMRSAWLGGFLVVISASSSVSAESIEPEVRHIISSSGFRPFEVAVFILGDAGQTLAAINAAQPFKPASNQKVLTTAAALKLLGPGHTYRTSLGATVEIREGKVEGELVLRGTGDPSISSRYYKGGPATLFRQWARELREKGLLRVTGGVVADDTFFDDVRLAPSWDERQQETWYSAQVSALTLNDNCVDVIVTPAAMGRLARVEIVPACPLIEVEGAPQTVPGGKSRVVVHRKPGTNHVSVSGQIGISSPTWRGNVTFHDPSLIFANTLILALKEEGIQVEGQIRKAQRDADGRGSPLAPRVLVALAEHSSTLLQDLGIILKRSQNLHAEILLKVLGAHRGGEGSVPGGDRAIREFLKTKKIPDTGVVVADGSGLSHQNRVTAAVLAKVLHSIRSERYFSDYLKSLPIAGEDGTLGKRFRRSPVRGMLHAKTGYIRGVSCLSGYLVRDKKTASFSILVNREKGGIGGAKALQEAIAEQVYNSLGK